MEAVFQNIHKQIIDQCLKGDAGAQLQLYKLYYKAMYNTAARILKDDVVAEDVMQEAFLEAFTKLKSYEGKSTFGAWLKKIVVHKSINELRKKKVNTIELDTADVAEESNNDEAYGHISTKQINEAIAQLPDGYRIILSLYLLEGYDHDEISQVLNISASTSRSQFARAKNKLRSMLLNEVSYE